MVARCSDGYLASGSNIQQYRTAQIPHRTEDTGLIISQRDNYRCALSTATCHITHDTVFPCYLRQIRRVHTAALQRLPAEVPLPQIEAAPAGSHIPSNNWHRSAAEPHSQIITDSNHTGRILRDPSLLLQPKVRRQAEPCRCFTAGSPQLFRAASAVSRQNASAISPGIERADRLPFSIDIEHTVHLPGQADTIRCTALLHQRLCRLQCGRCQLVRILQMCFRQIAGQVRSVNNRTFPKQFAAHTVKQNNADGCCSNINSHGSARFPFVQGAIRVSLIGIMKIHHRSPPAEEKLIQEIKTPLKPPTDFPCRCDLHQNGVSPAQPSTPKIS